MTSAEVHAEFHARGCPCPVGGDAEFAAVVVTAPESSFRNRVAMPVDVIVGDHGTTVMILFAQGPNPLPVPFGAAELGRYRS